MHTFEIYEEYYDWTSLEGSSDAQIHLLEYGGEDPPNMYQPKEPLVAKSYGDDPRRTRREYKRLLWMEMNGVGGVPKPVTLYEENGAWMFYLALPGIDAAAFLQRQQPEVIISTMRQIGRYLSFLHRQNIDKCPFIYSEDDIHTDPVFTHGDFTLSNVIINENYITGSVDLGNVGVRDRYFDLAAMTLDIRNVLGNQYVGHFHEGYRIKNHLDAGKLAQFIQAVEV
ncbi:phosphotransferase [Salinicoccus sp. ID82-1]|uniref:phosphotransferase n=1 Tax=Salinicoccus sp. ID82-1 TaxID=2820269 RepID=UPI001F1C8199|nr:phosphotransferase [Salinicoccus sp. ID82-1]MCG1010424.1 phosphotransferase [Salinicoccus sp. ID82-1]